MTKEKHYQMVDDSIVFFDHDTATAAEEIGARLKTIFKGVRFRNTSTGECEAADNVAFGPYISEHTGSFFLVVKANLKMDVPVDLEVRFIKGDTTLHYIDGRFAHVQEYKYFSGQGTHVEILLPGETEHSTSFTQHVLDNL